IVARRILADRRERDRLLRRLAGPRLRARPRYAPVPLASQLRGEDHVEYRRRRRDALLRRLRRPGVGARAPDRRGSLEPPRERPRVRHAGGRGRASLRAVVRRWVSDGVLDIGSPALVALYRRVCLFV